MKVTLENSDRKREGGVEDVTVGRREERVHVGSHGKRNAIRLWHIQRPIYL